MEQSQNQTTDHDIRELRHEVAELRKEQTAQGKDVVAIKTTLEVMQKGIALWIPLIVTVIAGFIVAVVGAWLNGKFK